MIYKIHSVQDHHGVCLQWHGGQCSLQSWGLSVLPDFGLAEQVVDNPHFYCDDILKGEKGFFGLEDCSLFRKKKLIFFVWNTFSFEYFEVGGIARETSSREYKKL